MKTKKYINHYYTYGEQVSDRELNERYVYPIISKILADILHIHKTNEVLDIPINKKFNK